MYLLAKFGDHKSYRNGDINSYIKSYMDTLGNAEFTTSIRRIARFLKTNTDLRFRSPGYGRQKNKKKKKKTCNCKAFAVSRKRSNTNKKKYITHV